MNDTMVLTNGLSSEDYQRQVANALAFLPAEEREEILAGVGEHLREVSAEGNDLVERLGTPQAYARELTTAAGLGDHGSVRRRLIPGGAWKRLRAHRWARAAGEFLPTLRPAWWVLRGYLAVVAITMAFDPSPTVLWWSRFWPIPTTSQGLGAGLAGVLLLVLAIPISISIGRRTLSVNARRGVVVVNSALLALGGYVLVDVGETVNNSLQADPYIDYQSTSGLRHHGAPIRNIVVFDANGQPLTDVRLFDQNGEPITVQSGVQRRFIQRSVDEFGVESRNTFPLVVVDRNGEAIPGKLATPVTTIPALKEPAAAKDDEKAEPTDRQSQGSSSANQ